MNKSQNTKNEQQKDLCITSEQLTEQWKKGELPYGRYYVELAYNGNSIIMAEYWWDKTLTLDDHKYSREEVKRILAPVPSYNEWQANENYIDYLKQCISVYESKDKQATETSIAYNELAKENEELKEILERHKKATAKAQIRSCDLEIINTQLKELLKKYKKQLSENKNAYIDLTTQDEYGSYYIDVVKLFVEIVGKTTKDFNEHKIDNAIGEKK